MFHYNHKDKTVSEVAGPKPDADDKKYHSILKGFDREFYNQDLDTYYASLRTFHAIGFSPEDEGRDIDENEFRLQHQIQDFISGKERWTDCDEHSYNCFSSMRRIVAIRTQPAIPSHEAKWNEKTGTATYPDIPARGGEMKIAGNERTFTLKEALDIWDAAVLWMQTELLDLNSEQMTLNKQQYFKEKFGITIY